MLNHTIHSTLYRKAKGDTRKNIIQTMNDFHLQTYYSLLPRMGGIYSTIVSK